MMSCQAEQLQKKRAANFSSHDKERLLNIIYKYKDIIENKKTDAVQNEEKSRILSRITLEFNACGGTAREAEQLKKLYNNQKKNLRRNAAKERKEILLTGGGSSQKRTNEDAFLRSIVNEKTIDGMINEFDGDHAGADLEHIEHNNEVVLSLSQPQDIQLLPLSEVGNENTNNAGTSSSQWTHYTPVQLQTPINTALKSSRRRPTPVVKALTSSDIAKKYDMLLDRRLSIAKLTEEQLQKTMAFEEIKRNMELKLLQTELEIKEEQLKKLRNSVLD